ncbi:slit homolog 1 protein-like [Acanthaster planci]|uniref:Slit homolog 1 protein-like n=1 Tax=Acanthaster planci TaxID=133434 RepID=A0A8B7ZGU2_ACAPL|nr:slit homolog 1 protein-like [Acanthaster planci]
MTVPASEEACRLCKCSNEGPNVVDCMQRGLTELPTGIPNDTQVLNLGGNQLTRIPYDALLQLESLITLNVTKNRISTPFELPETVISLFAGENEFRDIKPLVKNGVNLQAVVFRSNNLQVIETDTFKRCQKLLKLDLKSNSIREVQARGLAGPQGMTKLHMGSNKLKTLGPAATEGLQIQEIILYDNDLNVLKTHTFGKATNLGRLVLDNCKVEEIPSGLFVDPSVEYYERDVNRLDLGSNMIKRVSPGAFQGVKSFDKLQLPHNKLITLPEDMFATSKRIGDLILSNNQLVSRGLPLNLFINTSITTSLDISSNQLTTFPEELLRSQHKLQNLYIHRNKISSLNSGAFKGMESLKELMIFDNPITYLPDWVFYETKLVNLYMFQTNLSAIGSRPFATIRKTLQQVSLYGAKLAKVPDSVWQDLGANCYTAIDNCLQFAPVVNRTDLKIELVGDGFAQPIDVPNEIAEVLSRSGFQCRRAQKQVWQCTPCPQGHYGAYWMDPYQETCVACPAGGFYQSKTGQIAGKSHSINCQKCNDGTYVTPAAHPGISPADCVVCPTGTKKNLHAGFRACSCVDNYYRKDRFGECYPCPAEGLNCTGEYQHLLPGFWWTWDWGSDGNFRSYERFVKNLRTIPTTKDHWTESFWGATSWRAPDTLHSSAEGQGHEKISWKTFLCENYKPQFWYWEVVELVRKIVQTLFVLLYGPDDHFTMFATITISVGFLLVHAYVRPMKDETEHRLQMCSLGAIFLNLLAASLLLLPTDEHSQSEEERKGALAVFLILLNLSIIIFVAGSLVWGGVKTLWRWGCCGRTLTGLCWCLLQQRGSNESSDLDGSGESASLVPGPEHLQRPYGEIITERGGASDV